VAERAQRFAVRPDQRDVSVDTLQDHSFNKQIDHHLTRVAVKVPQSLRLTHRQTQTRHFCELSTDALGELFEIQRRSSPDVQHFHRHARCAAGGDPDRCGERSGVSDPDGVEQL
jgi:hypothetical protein